MIPMSLLRRLGLLGILVLVSASSNTPVSAQSCTPLSASNSSTIVNTTPQPCNYRPYSNTSTSPWNNSLPETPTVLAAAAYTTEVQTLAANSPTVGWRTEAANYFSGCTGPNCSRSLGGNFPPVWKATTTDPAVTFRCRPGYWCSQNDVTSFSATADIAGYIPANARTNCNVQGECGDVNMTIIQPNGAVIGLYGCAVSTNFVTGDTIGAGGTKCSGAVAYATLTTDKGLTGAITSGPMLDAELIRYNEVVPASARIPHALIIRASCTLANTFVYPANNNTFACTTGGIPAGTRFFLDRSLAQIDSMIAAGTLAANMKPFYYALHTYGAYVIDTGGCAGNHNFTCNLDGSPYFESAGPWILNGQTNPWIPWFQSAGASVITNGNGNQVWYFTNNFWSPVATYLKALDPCYASGTCADSIKPNAFAFSNATNQPTSSTITSSVVTLAGGFLDATATCTSGCTAISRNGSPFTAGPVDGFNSGDTIAIQQVSSAQANTTTSAGVTISTTASTSWQVTTALACSFTLSPSSATIAAIGGTSTFTVTASTPSCTWSSVSNVGWVTTTSSGTGTGTASYTVSSNATGITRVGTITTGGQLFTVTQTAATPPTVAVSQTTATLSISANIFVAPATLAITTTPLTLNILATAASTNGVSLTSVVINLDGTSIATLSAAPYLLIYNVSTLASGLHTITATATDALNATNTATTTFVK